MASFRALLLRFHASPLLLAVPLTLFAEAIALPPRAFSQAPANDAPKGSMALPQNPPESESQSSDPQAQPQSEAPKYDSAIFKNRLSSDQLTFLNQFVGRKSGDALRDKQFRKLMRSLLPDCIFHYGWDMSINDAMEKALDGSKLPVELRDERYLMLSGSKGPYLQGRGFLWIDMKDGIALGGFYFHPTNGEPTPTVTIFSRQVKEAFLGMSQLPPAFARDFTQWSAESNVPAVTTRYFIGASNRKILLEHDEDYCAARDANAAPASLDCEQMDADAADIDLEAAYYLDQTNYATNATAWMIVGPEQVAWIQVRDNTCRVRADRLRCRVRLTHERTHVIINRHSVAQLPHGSEPSHK
jgi:uncharacterized protein YecT (DUF1311 family)